MSWLAGWWVHCDHKGCGGVVVVALSKEAIDIEMMVSLQEENGVGVTVTAYGVVRAEVGAGLKAKLERGVPSNKGVALHILNRCSINKSILKKL